MRSIHTQTNLNFNSINHVPAQVSIKSLQDLDPLLSKKFLSKHEELFVEVACGDQTFRTNCFKVTCVVAFFGFLFMYMISLMTWARLMALHPNQLKSISVMAVCPIESFKLSLSSRSFLVTFYFPVIRPTLTMTLMSVITGTWC